MRIAQRFNVGSEARACVSPEGTADSLPEVPFVVGDTMFLEQSQELLLEHTMIQPSLRDLYNRKLPVPTLKGWAIITRPSGTDFRASSIAF